jgi:hypothetical protein
MNTFIEQVLADLVKKQIDIAKITYVVPSKRVSVFLSKYIAQDITTPIFLPKIYSIEEYIAQLAGVEILKDLDLLPLFYQAYKNVENNENIDSFDQFIGWATTILRDFNEIDRYLVNPEQFFNYLDNVKEMDHWARSKNPTQLVSKYLRFWKKLHSYYIEFQKLCLENNIAYQGMAYRLAFAKAEQNINTLNQEQKIIFLGLNALNTAESKIIQLLLNEDKAEIYWDIDSYLISLKYHEAGKFIRHFLKKWKYYERRELPFYNSTYTTTKKISLHGAAGNLSVIQVAAKLIAQLPIEEVEDTAIVLADERLLLPVLDVIPESIPHFNVTMGLSLDQLPLATFINDIIKLHAEKTDNSFYYKGVIQVLESSFMYILIGDATRNIIKHIKENNLIYINASSDEEFIKSPLVRDLLQNLENVGSLIKLIQQVLDELKIKLLKEKNRRLEIEQLLGVTEVMQQLSNIINTNHEVKDFKTIAYLYKQLIPLKKLDFIGEPVKGLQIMGLLETRALDYKNIIMLSVNEGLLPAGKSTASYISNDMKHLFQLPNYSEKDSIYAYHFYRLLQRATTASFIYNTEGDTLGGGEKSRFLTQLETDQNSNHIVTHEQYVFKNSAAEVELMVIKKETSYFERLEEIALSGFSPSALTSYVRNPIDFYANKILKVNEIEDVEENIAANTMGSIIHEALEQLYQPYINRVLIKEDFDTIKKQIQPQLAAAYQKEYVSTSPPMGNNKIIYEVSSHYINKMIKSDLDLVINGKELIIKSLERRLEAVVQIPKIGNVKIIGMVDRIDQLDGTIRIIDYKTGAVANGNVGIKPDDYEILKEGYEKSKAFQILMYTYLYSLNEPFTEALAGIISFKSFNRGFIPFSIKEKNTYVPKLIDREILKNFEQVLFALIQELYNPEIPLTEKAL